MQHGARRPRLHRAGPHERRPSCRRAGNATPDSAAVRPSFSWPFYSKTQIQKIKPSLMNHSKGNTLVTTLRSGWYEQPAQEQSCVPLWSHSNALAGTRSVCHQPPGTTKESGSSLTPYAARQIQRLERTDMLKIPRQEAHTFTITTRKWAARGSPGRVQRHPRETRRTRQRSAGHTGNGVGGFQNW